MSGENKYRERTVATQWAENYPIRNATRQAIFHALCRVIDNDRKFYWSVLRLSWRTGFATSTIASVLAEFVTRGLLEDTGERRGKGGTRVYRLHYERSFDAYPDTVTWEEFKANAERESAGVQRNKEPLEPDREVHREPVKFNGTEVHREPVKFNGTEVHREPVKFDDSNFTEPALELHRSTARTSPIRDPNFTDPGTELHRLTTRTSPAVGDKGLRVLRTNIEDAHCRVASGEPPREDAHCRVAAPPSASAAALHPGEGEVHGQQSGTVQRSKKTSYRDRLAALDPEVRERAGRITERLRSCGVVKGWKVPRVAQRWAADPRVTDDLIDEAIEEYRKCDEVQQRVRLFASTVEAVLFEREQKKPAKRSKSRARPARDEDFDDGAEP
ncbi:hypothetical protein [Paraburkholderia sp. Cpub6]|uniref:hypothetical protein n=1 Tax=Paraburkholderia sp. Cpub6 TaxID=2723094 RepID=UPI0016148F94|nr:hypothetical protein [Paraburkholderia sp. Cpub6]MBB5456901.1 hypothetical protein [Paraburkholderia sp. Cpub6]